MIEFTTIRYLGATLVIPAFLPPLWPYQMPIEKWPTFCGAGDGIGDKIVPDRIHGVQMAPACFTHDIEWAVTPNTLKAFMLANWHFLRNCLALIDASDLGCFVNSCPRQDVWATSPQCRPLGPCALRPMPRT